jgi:hypothetical protein
MFYDMGSEPDPFIDIKCSKCAFTLRIIHDHKIQPGDSGASPLQPLAEALAKELAFA